MSGKINKVRDDKKNGKLKIVFLDRYTAGPIQISERFSKYGEYVEYDETTREILPQRIKEADVVITNRVKLKKDMMEKAENLKLILVTATGYNHIDVEAANDLGIKVANVSEYSTASVAQLTFTYILESLTPITRYSQEVKGGRWENVTIPQFQSYPIGDVEGKVLGILGYGNIGRRVAEIGRILRMEVMVAKIPGRDYGIEEKVEDRRYELEEVLRKCDFLSIHAPLTDLTRGLISYERMTQMKRSTVILNLARGPIIDQDGLYKALKNKVIKGAAIDVTSVEPIEEGSRLLELDNIIITPHIAWKSERSMERLMDGVEDNLKKFLAGKLEGIR